MRSGLRVQYLVLFLLTCALFVPGRSATAEDLAWSSPLDLRAQADPLDFQSQLRMRFGTSDAQLRMVLGTTHRPSDAYLVLRLAELTRRPLPIILDSYRQQRPLGWGALAQSLGIKPGSQEFHALKAGDDPWLRNFTGSPHPAPGHGKGKGHAPGRGHKPEGRFP